MSVPDPDRDQSDATTSAHFRSSSGTLWIFTRLLDIITRVSYRRVKLMHRGPFQYKDNILLVHMNSHHKHETVLRLSLWYVKNVYIFKRVLELRGSSPQHWSIKISQRTRDAIITSFLRQNDVTMSFWRNNDVIITSYVRWDIMYINSLWPSVTLYGDIDLSQHWLGPWWCSLPGDRCWLISSKVMRYSSQGIIIRKSEDTNPWHNIELYICIITSISPGDQWVNLPSPLHRESVPIICFHQPIED